MLRELPVLPCSGPGSRVEGLSLQLRQRGCVWVCVCVCVCVHARACAKSFHLCPTLCKSMDCSSSGSSVHGILQARILEQAAMPSSGGYSQPRDGTHVSHISRISRQVLYQ